MARNISALILSAILLFSSLTTATRRGNDCTAPELICKAAANQDRSLYVRDRCRYEQKIRVERFKLKDGKEQYDEIRETTVVVQPQMQPDKTGKIPVDVQVVEDTDKKGNPKDRINPEEKTLLSFGAVWDLAFFPLLPEKLQFYNYQEVVAERKSEKWYRFIPKPEVLDQPLAAGVVMLDPATGEVLTIKIESLHNLNVLDKNAAKLRTFYATIDYSQFEGALRIPTLASGGGVSEIPKFGGNFRFKFAEGKYRPVAKID
ncbi:MAG: hypothetical protein AB1757_28965 [Acidobacteriota bacterium]